MSLMTSQLLAIFIVVFTSASALAQRTVGEVLDAGGKALSPQEFHAEVVQRFVVGPTPTGGSIQLMHGANGVLSGTGTIPNAPARLVDRAQVSGGWNIDAAGRVCITARFRHEGGGAGPAQLDFLPPRCHVWFKLGRQYYVADSGTDRSAKVLVRALKQ